VLVLVALFAGARLALGFGMPFTPEFGMRSGRVGAGGRLWFFLGMLFVSVGLLVASALLTRQAWKQLSAVRQRLFHGPPYSASVARLAIELRKRDLLRSLHLTELNAVFLTEEDPAIRARRYRGAS
jgi:hypothetical protein